MQTVFTTLEIQPAFGSLGFSFLRHSLTGSEPQRMTLIVVRDTRGLTETVLIVPAETVRGAF